MDEDAQVQRAWKIIFWALAVVVALSALVLLVGCEKPEIATESPTEAMNRFTVTYCGRFPTRGMGETVESRSIYLLKDKETGLEYVMVQGCGTACLESRPDNSYPTLMFE